MIKNFLLLAVLWGDQHCKAHVTNQFSKIIKLKTPLLDFRNFKYYSEKIPTTGYELLLKSYWWYFLLFWKMNFLLFIRQNYF
jgi:hypothetical protein